MRRNGLNPEDIFIKRIQNALLQKSIAGWRRRGKLLLDINCGDGRYLRKLWQNGFDVTATEADHTLRKRAQSVMHDRAEIYAAHDTHLPFEDKAFDWAVVHIMRPPKHLKEILEEAVRVAGHGLAVTFWNATSPIFLFSQSAALRVQPISWFTVWNTLRSTGEGTVSTRSTLLFPYRMFHNCPSLYFSPKTSCLPIGAWATLRLDMSPQSTVTPLALPTRLRKIPRFEPVLESTAPRVGRNNIRARS
ncbi:MAG: class I SAM-dependent methyltransferase [Desulfovibrionaceae bacterium]|nr:class I SAM-dependent methyltransferase [Desulfovibrionaceae bacterium]